MNHPEFCCARVAMVICLDLHAVGMPYNAYLRHAKSVFTIIFYPHFAPNGAFLKFGMTHVCSPQKYKFELLTNIECT